MSTILNYAMSTILNRAMSTIFFLYCISNSTNNNDSVKQLL